MEFAKAFQQSRLASIDSFLSRRTEYSEIGKLVIASLLVPKEKENIFNRHIEADWYFALWNALAANVTTVEELKKNNVQIYTFNYDRSLERYLHIAIINTFNISSEEALNVLSYFNINHVYGSLGLYGDQSDYAQNIRAYTPEYNQSAIEAATATLRVIPEARAEDTIFKRAREAFIWAGHVCFLGFGFDPLNVQRLGFKKLSRSYKRSTLPYKVVASTLGRTHAEVELIHAATIGVTDFHDDKGKLRVHWGNYECLETLRRFAWLLQ